MTDDEFNALFGSDAGGQQQQQQPQQAQAPAAPQQAPAPTGNAGNPSDAMQAGLQAAMADFASRGPQNTDSILGAIGTALGAPGVAQTEGRTLTPEEVPQAAAMGGAGFVTGGLKSVFETKDFLFGDTPVADQSGFRRDIEQLDADMKQASPIIGGLSSGIGQFAVAMVGLGKVAGVAKMVVPGAKAGVAAVEGIKGGKVALESGKAALAGAIAFDPHEERLSNLVQDTFLANPINEWLAAKPDDTAAWGRVKNAMESIGMDAAIIGTLKLGGTVWKKLKAGDHAGASRTITDFENKHLAPEAPAAQGAPTDGRTPQVSPEGAGAPQQPPQQAGGQPGDGLQVQDPLASGGPQGTAVDGLNNAGPDEAAAAQTSQAVATNPSVVDTPTQAMEQAGVAKPSSAPLKDPVQFTREDMAGNPDGTGPLLGEGASGPRTRPVYGLLDELDLHLENAEKDWDNLDAHGTWQDTLDSGKRVGPDMGTFYDRFRSDEDLLNAIDLAVVHKADQLATKGFRVKLTDEKLQKQVRAFASLANVDPAGLMGILQQAGEASKTLTAKMVVVGSLTAKTFQDASLMAMRLKLGDFTEFGSREAMEQAIAKRFTLATTLLKLTDDIRAQGGRTLRANRGKPFDPALFEGLEKDRFYALLAESGGNPAKLKHLADPALLVKIADTANYLRINSLVSGWTTQAINVMSNGYMLGARPLERILGASAKVALLGDDASGFLIKENLRQYAYTGTALWDAFKTATKAFTLNESVIRPHSNEVQAGARWQVPGSQAFGAGYFKKWDSLPNIIHNALSVPLSVVGIPTRTLGSIDELMKQVVYRSKLMARAHTDGLEEALTAGLKGKQADDFVRNYVKEKLEHAFDNEGRGLDAEALREASIATFQQDLLPGTMGRNVQTFISNDKTHLSRFILPFVKTPTNVIRYAIKMTPGLGILQTEYREMLWGRMGKEAQAQAVGQMTMGGLFMGSAAFIGQDRITGGGPSDPKIKEQMLATGWRPYSIVTTNEDGTKTYVPFNRMDPVALPFGIIADIQDAIHVLGEGADENSPEVSTAITALMISLAKQFTSRTYLLSLNQALDALGAPDRKGEAFMGQMASSFVPFSSATRQMSTDPFLRDARTVADKMLQAIPGLSTSLRPKYDWLGQPIVNRQGLWTDDNGTLVDREVQRLGMLPEGSVITAPNPVWNKVDLRDITLTTGENAYEAYQRLAGQPGPNVKTLRTQAARIINSPAYARAPDGDLGTRGTRLWLLNRVVDKYRRAAGERIRADKNVREALMRSQRKVVDHYQHLKEEPSDGAKASVKALMDGFGAGSGQ